MIIEDCVLYWYVSGVAAIAFCLLLWIDVVMRLSDDDDDPR